LATFIERSQTQTENRARGRAGSLFTLQLPILAATLNPSPPAKVKAGSNEFSNVQSKDKSLES
jgi:hypothetical protein